MNYYMNLLSVGTRGAYIALAVPALAAIFIFFQAILAYGRGTSRSLARLLTVAGAAAVAFFATRIIGRGCFPDKTVSEVIGISSTRLGPILNAPASEILLPFVFVVLFLLFSLFLVLPYKLFCGIFGFSYERNNVITRCFAVLIGAVHALLTCFILLLPFFGCVRAYEKAAIETPAGAVSDIYDRYFEDTAESPLYEYSMKYVGDRVLDAFSKAKK